MRKLTIGKEEFRVPAGFEECTAEQISGVLVAQQALGVAKELKNDDKIDRVKRSILFCLIPDLSLSGWNMLTVWQKATVMNLVRWAFVSRIENKPFECIETKKGDRLYLPAADYADTTAIEWALLNIYYLAYSRNPKNTDFFFNIIGVLCRPERIDIEVFRNDPKGWNGDVREPFNMTRCEERLGDIKEVPFGMLLAVFQYWEKMNTDFVKRNDELFDGDDDEGLFSNGEGCLSMLEDIAEEGTLGDLDKVHETNVVNVFLYMRHKLKKLRKRERELAKQNDE